MRIKLNFLNPTIVNFSLKKIYAMTLSKVICIYVEVWKYISLQRNWGNREKDLQTGVAKEKNSEINAEHQVDTKEMYALWGPNLQLMFLMEFVRLFLNELLSSEAWSSALVKPMFFELFISALSWSFGSATDTACIKPMSVQSVERVFVDSSPSIHFFGLQSEEQSLLVLKSSMLVSKIQKLFN